MNRDDVIRMAREAGFDTDLPGFRDGSAIALKLAALVAAAKDAEHKEAMRWDIHSCGPTCKRYACVATREAVAAEREKVAAWMIQRGYATGHGDTTEDLLKELDWKVLANWSSAMKTGAENEREALEQIDWTTLLRQGGLVTWGDAETLGDRVIAAIRARSNT